MKLRPQRGPLALEALSEEDFPLGDSWSCCPSSCCPLIFCQESGKNKEHKPKLLGLDIFRSGGVSHVKGWGLKSSVCPSKPREKLWAGYSRDFCGRPKSLRKEIVSAGAFSGGPFFSRPLRSTPYDSYGKSRAPFWPFWEKDFGHLPTAPSFLGPFGLLLIVFN